MPRWSVVAISVAAYWTAALLGSRWAPAAAIWLGPVVGAILARELRTRDGVLATLGVVAVPVLVLVAIDATIFAELWRLGLLPSLAVSLAVAAIAGITSSRLRLAHHEIADSKRALQIANARSDFSQSVLHAEDVADLCRRCASGLVELFGLPAARVSLVDFVAGVVNECAVAGRAIRTSAPNELRNSPFADVIANGETVQVPNHESLRFEDPQPRFIWATPLQTGSRLLGVVSIGLDDAIEPATHDALVAIGEQVAQLIEKHQTQNALRRSQFAIDHANVGVLLCSATGRIQYANELACRLVGYRQREIGERTLLDLVANDSHQSWKERVAAADGASFTCETELVRSSRHHVPVELTVSRLTYGGETVTCVFARDISAQRAAIEALREANERFELVTRGANDGHWDWDLRNGKVHFSDRWKAIIGLAGDELGPDPDQWVRRIHPEDLGDFRSRLSAHLQGATPHLESEYRIRHKDGTWIWVLTRGVAVHDETGNPYRIGGSMTETTDRRKREEELTESAFLDSVTGMANRGLFLNRLDLAVRRSQRLSSYRFALLCLDLDRFNMIVDSLGRSVSDRLLRAIAARLESCARPGDTIARIGGDEFAILLDEIGEVHDATRIADRILKEMKPAFSLTPHEIYSSVSIGIAIGSDRYQSAEEVLRDADTAMYRAKANGRGRHEVFNTSMHTKAVEKLRLETDLQRALKREEFRLFYQPVIDLRRQTLVGFEALIRWEHPTRGLLPPAEFIGTAEETGLIVPIGAWVAREACFQLKAWLTRFIALPELFVAINLSARQFADTALVKGFRSLLSESGVPGSNLRIEITESILMGDVERAHTVLSELRSLGIRVMMDDFGTGYSSLAYLHQFPVDNLKVDRSFVSSSAGGPLASHQIVRSIVNLARDLNMDVTAEGVENAEQLDQLVELGCGYGQGYLFARPAPAGQCETLLKELHVGAPN